jgi:hypothetical protein
MEKTKVDYIIAFFFLIISSKATFLYHYDAFWMLFILMSLLYGFVQKRIFLRNLYVFAGFGAGYILYMLFRNFAFNHLPPQFIISDIFFLLKFILFSYTFCVVLKENATSLFSEVVIKLAYLSLGLYAFQLVGGGDILYKIGDTFLSYTPYLPGRSATFSNFFFFTYDKLHVYRNSGFAWEPGAYGCFLVVALFFYLINNNLKIDKNVFILSIALFTTISTTAIMGFAFLVFLIYRARGGKWNYGIISLIIIFGLSFFYLPFLGDKIKETYENDVKVLDDWEAIDWDLDYYYLYGGEFPLNRFASAIFLHRHFENQLIFGVSNAYTNLKSKIYGVEISRFNLSNGIMDFITKFGYLGTIFLLFKFGQFPYKIFGRVEYSLYFIFAFLCLGFGEPIFVLPLSLIFLFLPSLNLIDFNLVNDSITAESDEEKENREL